jgi:ATP-dependent RNA helicase DeaD
MENFDSLGLPPALAANLAAMQFTTPTPIQAQAIPHALAGRDVLGSAQTGTGKTGAFGIPMAAKLLTSSRGTALVMTPTRELATQVLAQLGQMLGGAKANIKTALLIGGDSMPKQLQQLRARPRLIVGTPGRINDHLERGSLMLHDTNFLVLDETDRMLDMGFTVQIQKILKFMPQTRQTMLFSATLPANIVKIANSYMQDPVRVAVSADSAPAANLTHEMVRLQDADKYPRLIEELNKRSGSVIIFVKTKHATSRLALRLAKAGHHAEAIHGDLRQSKRDSVIAAFRAKKHRILVATDIAARGLDIPHIEHVINYDLPQAADDFIHRIGRTARAGATGEAISLVSPADRIKWEAIAKLTGDASASSGKQERAETGNKPQKSRSRNGRRNGKPAAQAQDRPQGASGSSRAGAPMPEGAPRRLRRSERRKHTLTGQQQAVAH